MARSQLISCTTGGLLPGLALYLAFFYPRHKLQLRCVILLLNTGTRLTRNRYSISIFFVSTSLAGTYNANSPFILVAQTLCKGAFSGLLAAAIVKMEGVGGRHGWAWIFILVSPEHLSTLSRLPIITLRRRDSLLFYVVLPRFGSYPEARSRLSFFLAKNAPTS